MGSRLSSREKILQCAREMFYHQGYQATSVDDILKQCGVAKSNFYYHFETKEQLAVEVLELRIAEHEALLLQSLQNETLPPTERLDRFFGHLCRAQAEVQKMAGCPFGNLAASLSTHDGDDRHERFRMRLSQLFRRTEAAIWECLAEGAKQSEFRADIDPAELAAFVMAAVEGLFILTKTYRDTAPMVRGFAVIRLLLLA